MNVSFSLNYSRQPSLSSLAKLNRLRLTHRLRHPSGEMDKESAAQPCAGAFRPNPAPVHLDQTAAQGESQSRALLLARVGRIYLLKLAPDPFQVFGVQADPGVPHPEFEHAGEAAGAEMDTSADRRKLDSIRKQVVENLLQAGWVGPDRVESRLDFQIQRQAFFLGKRAEDRAGCPQRLGDIAGDRLQTDMTGFDLGQVQHIIDEFKQVPAAGKRVADISSLPVVKLAECLVL